MEEKNKKDVIIKVKKFPNNTFFIDVDIISKLEKKKFEKSLKMTANAIPA